MFSKLAIIMHGMNTSLICAMQTERPFWSISKAYRIAAPIRFITAAAYAALMLFALVSSSAHAVDHIDGHATISAPGVDLTDLYAFTRADDPQTLVVILNARTAPLLWERPDPDAVFEIVIAPLSTDGFLLPDVARYVLGCRWTNQGAECSDTLGAKLTIAEGDKATTGGLVVFAGKRSDPFVLNGIWAAELALKNEVPAPSSANIIANLNVFALVVELDISRTMPELGTRALAIGAHVRDVASGHILDRVGRPEIANIALQSNSGPDLRDLLNQQHALDLSDDIADQLRVRLRENLDRYDAMNPAQYGTDKDSLAQTLSQDYLTIDPTLPCKDSEYFALEWATLQGKAPQVCGGRPLEEDVIDTVYGLLIMGDPRSKIADGVNLPTQASTEEFPYLAPPNEGAKATLFALTGRGLAILSVAGPQRNVLIGTMLGLFFLLIYGLWRLMRKIFVSRVK